MFYSGDCAPYTVKYIEWLSMGREDLTLISEKTIDQCTFDIANSVYEHVWKTMIS